MVGTTGLGEEAGVKENVGEGTRTVGVLILSKNLVGLKIDVGCMVAGGLAKIIDVGVGPLVPIQPSMKKTRSR